jgi:hypothetical protein
MKKDQIQIFTFLEAPWACSWYLSRKLLVLGQAFIQQTTL